MATQTAPAAQQLTVKLSEISVAEGFNPRRDAEQAEIARLAKSIAEHGLIHPLVVCPDDGGYRLYLQ